MVLRDVNFLTFLLVLVILVLLEECLELERIQFRGFKPRDEMERDVRRVAQKILDEAPSRGKARLVITDQGGQFHISIVGTDRHQMFSSESFHKKEEMKGWPRGWQLGAVAELLTDFIQQVRNNFRFYK